MTPKTHIWPSGRTRELPGSLPGSSRWRKRPGRIMVMVTYIAPACSSACTSGAHLCICRPIGGHPSSSARAVYLRVAAHRRFRRAAYRRPRAPTKEGPRCPRLCPSSGRWAPLAPSALVRGWPRAGLGTWAAGPARGPLPLAAQGKPGGPCAHHGHLASSSPQQQPAAAARSRRPRPQQRRR